MYDCAAPMGYVFRVFTGHYVITLNYYLFDSKYTALRAYVCRRDHVGDANDREKQKHNVENKRATHGETCCKNIRLAPHDGAFCVNAFPMGVSNLSRFETLPFAPYLCVGANHLLSLSAAAPRCEGQNLLTFTFLPAANCRNFPRFWVIPRAVVVLVHSAPC